MPYRIEAAMNLLATAFSALAAMAAAIVATMAGQPDGVTTAQTTEINVVVWDVTALRMTCLVGAIGGAFLSVAIFPEKGASARELAMKFLASGVAGVIFTPMAIRWMGWSADTDGVLFCAGAVALCAIGIIRVVVPLAEKVIGRKFGVALDPGGDALGEEESRKR